MNRTNFIDIDDKNDDNITLLVYVDPKKHNEQEKNTQFAWIYKIRSSIIYTEEFDPERRIRDAYCKSVKQEIGTLLFHPYKKPYSSCVFKRFILEDPYDQQRAIIKYCREKPLKFIIFGKPGLNIDSLGTELVKYWNCVHITPDIAIKNKKSLETDKKIETKLRSGSSLKVLDTWKLIKDMINQPDSKRLGYVISGLPLGYHSNAEFDVIEQMEYIFQTNRRPDVIIYVTCPTIEVAKLNEQGFIEDLNSGYYFNKSHITDGEKLSDPNLNKNDKLDYSYFLKKEYQNCVKSEKHGFMIKTQKLPMYSRNHLDIYVKKVLPVIDSYILEYDSQCVIKVDGRIPVLKMFEIVKEKLSILPFYPVCQAKPLFEEIEVNEADIEFLDDRSIDSIEEDKEEIVEEESSDDDNDEEDGETKDEEEEQVEEAEENNEEFGEEGEEEEEEEGKTKRKTSVGYYNRMETKAALKRLKDRKPIHPNFKWQGSDFGILCPVEFERGNICRGIAGFTCSYLGKLYMMSSLKAMFEFLYDPNRFIIPPKPFPTLKIFVTGPPCSGKTATVQLLSEFFQLEIVSIKELIEEMNMKKFSELEAEVFAKKVIKVKKLEKLEADKLKECEEKRAIDIINWIKEVLPIIFERAKYSSLVNLEFSIIKEFSQTFIESPQDEPESQKLVEDNVDEEVTKEKVILPNVPNLLELIDKLSLQKEMKKIISPKKYKIDFPPTTGMKKIFENPVDDPRATLVKNISFESADTDLKLLQSEFQNRGLDFFWNTEGCQRILKDPRLLLDYVPDKLRKPYYEIPNIDFYDQRIRKIHNEDVGIRTAFGYVSFSMEELGDAFERKILNIEAEMNMQHRANDLRIGGWIVDDIPLHTIFWNILIDRFLLPDDIIIQKVTKENFTKIIDNFCNIVNFQKNKLKEENITGSNTTMDLTSDLSSDSLDDPQINRFLHVKNSFLKINDHYETNLESKESKPLLKKVCNDQSKSPAEEGQDKNEYLKEKEVAKENSSEYYRCIWSSTQTLGYSREANEMYFVQNPFDLNGHHVKPFYRNFWDDDLFLTRYFEEITNLRIIPDETKNPNTSEISKQSEINTTAVEEIESSSLKYMDKNRKNSISSKGSLNTRKKLKDEEESISSSSEEKINDKLGIKTQRKTIERSAFTDVKSSISKKTKKLPQITAKSKILPEISVPKGDKLFELECTHIVNTKQNTIKLYNIFEILQEDFTSFMVKVPQALELKYLKKIRDLLKENADMKTIGSVLQRYMKKVHERVIEVSEDNIILMRPSVDMGSIEKKIKPKKGSKLINIFSDYELRPPVRRMKSLTKFDFGKMESTSIIQLQRNAKESRLSAISLPKIKQQKMRKDDTNHLKHLFEPQTIMKDSNLDEDLKETKGETEGEEIENTRISQDYEVDVENEEICLVSSEIICIAPGEDFQKSSSVLLNVSSTSQTSDIPIPTHRSSKKFHLPPLKLSDEKLMKKHSCYCNETQEREEFCTCHSSSGSEIMIGRHKKRLCIWHESSQIIPWVPQHERERKKVEQLHDKTETVRLKKLREKLLLPTISSSEIESIHTFNQEDEPKDILYHNDQDSAISVVYATSSNDIVRWRKQPDIVAPESDISSEKFELATVSSTALLNKEDYDSQILLPNLTAIDWERFINFVNSIYLNVSTLKEAGYEPVSSSLGSFYLECCPSGSDSLLSGYRPTGSSSKENILTQELYTKDEIKAIAKEFVTKLHGQNPEEFEERESYISCEDEDEDLCVLEVNLPLTESKFSSALNTALICLTRGKTITELFSADKHETSGKKRLSSHELNIMAQDQEVKEIEMLNVVPSSDRISTQMYLSDEFGDKLPEHQQGFIELFEGNVMRYKSLDERYRDVDHNKDENEDNDEIEETSENRNANLFLPLVPKAILYVPFVVDSQKVITPNTRVTCEHLRRYYSVQSRCHMVFEDINDNTVKFKYILREPIVTVGKKIYKHKKPLNANIKENRTRESKQSVQKYEEEEEEEEEEEVVEEEKEEEEEEEDKEEEPQDIQEEEEDQEDKHTIEKTKEITDATEKEIKTNDNEIVQSDQIGTADKEIKGQLNDKESKINNENRLEKIDNIEEEKLQHEILEEKSKKSLEFSFPYDIIKLLFEKYEIISFKLPEDDIDEELSTALSSLTIPRSFERFLRALHYNIEIWLNEWEAFENDMLKDIHCNLLDNDFLPFYCDLQTHNNNIVLKFLHNYEPSAEVVDKEELIKTIDLEKNALETESLQESDEELTEEIIQRDIGDTDVHEILPNQFSDSYPFCPIILNDKNELVPANDTLKAGFRDLWYNFSSEEAMKKFISTPERYIPLKNAEHISIPLRICIVAPGDFNGIHFGRNIADIFGVPFNTLSGEIKRLKSDWVDLPVGIFDEDQVNIKLFSLEGEKDKHNDYLENEQWDHYRDYYNLSSPLTDHEIDTLIQPLWKHDVGFIFYSFPYSFNDLECLVKNEMIPDVIVFIDNDKKRIKERQEVEQRIKTRQLLNFGARLKKLLAADHLRFNCWKGVYPKLFNIVLRKFLKARRADRNFRERLLLIKPTVKSPEASIASEVVDEEIETQTWDVDWLLSQVGNDSIEKMVNKAKKVKKFTNVLDDPTIKPDVKKLFFDGLKPQIKIELVVENPAANEKSETSISSELSNRSIKEKLNTVNPELAMASYPDLKVLLEPTSQITEENEEEEEEEIYTSSSEKLITLRDVAVTDFFDPPFTKRYLPESKPEIFKTKKEFDEEDYRNNVTNASSSISLGLDDIDSIQSREITSSITLLDVDSFNKEERLLHLIFGKQPPLKGLLIDIVKQYKTLYPAPKTNVRNLKRVQLSHSREKLDEYYQKHKENVKKMQDLCIKQNIAYVNHKSTLSFDYLLQNIKNVIRKPNALEKVYIINNKLAIELIQNGVYFLSRFGYWCPVQIYEKENPILGHYPMKIKEIASIPVIHKRYIYFINGRNSMIKFIEAPLKYIKQDTILSMFPVKIAIIGSHKSKKSRTVKNLANLHGLEPITLEKALDYVTQKLYWTDLSKSILANIRKGDVLQTSCLVECLEAFINSSSKALTYGWVLDGFPINEDNIDEMKDRDIIPQVIFSIESDGEFTKNMFENLDYDKNEIQKVIYHNEEYIDMTKDEEEDKYYENSLNSTEEQDFDERLIDFEIKNLLPPVIIMEKRMVNWLHEVTTYDKLLDKANVKWGNVFRVEWKKDENVLLNTVNEILMVYLWALQDYNTNLTKGIPASVYLVGITEDEYNLHRSPFKDCCPGCWYYNRIYFRCPTCKFKDMKPGLIQYENFFYWLCLQHYNTFLSDPLKFLMSYKTAFAKHYPEKTNIGENYIKDNFDIMNNGICITCYYKNLPNTVYNKGYSQYSVVMEKKKIYLFCSDKCACEMLMNPTRYLNLEIHYKDEDKLPSLIRLSTQFPPKGFLEQLVTDAIYESIRKFLFLRPKIYKLSHQVSACTYLALNLKVNAKYISERERNYYKSLLEYFENHCKENETLCKNLNQIMAFMGPLSMLEYFRNKNIPPKTQTQLLNNLLPSIKGRKKYRRRIL